MNISERIAAAIQYANTKLNKNGRALATEAEITPAWISKLKQGKSQLGADKLYPLARATGCRPEWIAEGVGSMTGSASGGTLDVPFYGDTSRLYSVSLSVVTGLGLDLASLFALEVSDETMAHTFVKGDVLLIDLSQKTLESRMVFALATPGGTVRVNRLIELMSGEWIIRCDNDDKRRFPDERVAVEALKPIGRVVWRGGAV